MALQSLAQHGNKSSEKMNTNDRVLSLKLKEGTTATSSTGLVDNRLFTNENRLHALREPGGLWYLRYEQGALPGPLKQRFTNFNVMFSFVKEYFNRRNIEVTENG